MRFRLNMLALALLLGWCLTAQSEEWPKWRGPEGTGISTEKIADSWPADGPKRIWAAEVGIGFSSPIALDGKVYLFSQTGNDDTLTAFDAQSGKVIWTQSSPTGESPQYPGTRGTPTIDGERIYTYGCGGDLICRNLADGKQQWRINILDTTKAERMRWGQASSPLVDEQNVYVMSGMNAKSIAVAVNKATGAVAWSSQAKGAGSYSTIIASEIDKQKQLIALGGDSVYGIDPKTGATLWSAPWQTKMAINAATPVFDGMHLFITSAYDQGSTMLAVTPTSAKSDWAQRDLQCRFQPPVLDGKLLFCNSEGRLKCLSWPDGKTLWTGELTLKLGAGGSLVRAGDKLIVMSERGKLILLHADAAGCKVISQVALFDYDKVWSTPLIYRGKLYAKGKDQLVCLDISPAETPK